MGKEHSLEVLACCFGEVAERIVQCCCYFEPVAERIEHCCNFVGQEAAYTERYDYAEREADHTGGEFASGVPGEYCCSPGTVVLDWSIHILEVEENFVSEKSYGGNYDAESCVEGNSGAGSGAEGSSDAVGKRNERPVGHPVERLDERLDKCPDERPAEHPDEHPDERSDDRPGERPDDRPGERLGTRSHAYAQGEESQVKCLLAQLYEQSFH